MPNWVKDLNFNPETWSEKLGVPRWKKELQQKICNGVDGAEVDGAKCGRGAFERVKSHLLEKLDVEQSAKIDLKSQLRSCEMKHEEQTNLLQEQVKRLLQKHEEHTNLLQEQVTRLLEERESWNKKLASESGSGFLVFLILVCLCGIFCLLHQLTEEINARKSLRQELESTKKQLESDLGDTLSLSDHHENLGDEFSFHISDEVRDQGQFRTIKIQCPGVCPNAVFVAIISNGCEVTIDRQASNGVDAASWKKRFQFKPSEGVFEFNEDQTVLENGYLTLVFDIRVFADRIFRLPQSRHCAMDSEIATSSSAIDTRALNETCVRNEAMQIPAEVAQEQVQQDSQLTMLPESAEMLRESLEKDCEEDHASDTSSNSTLDGFEHVEFISEIQ